MTRESSPLDIQVELVEQILVRFLREELGAAGFERAVVGLSGGVDSAVSAALAARALGAQNLLCVLMPYRTSNPDSAAHAELLVEHLGCASTLVDISAMADGYLAAQEVSDPTRRGNVMARCRMIVLYDRSAREGALVLGTGNRTEGLLGYTTMHGDNACGLNPIGQLYKTEIRLLAAWLGLPEAVITKAPSADLWEGQADEDELGFTYAEVDGLLHLLVDQDLGPRRLEALGYAPALVEKVSARMRAMAFKRQTPPVAAFEGRRDPDTVPATLTDGGFH